MAEKGVNEVPKKWRELFERGMTAVNRSNWDYAITIFNQILQNEPGLYPCREALRAAQFKKLATRGGFFRKIFGSARSRSRVTKAQLLLRNRPLEAIRIAEEILNSDPNNTAAHRLLAEAATEADLPKTAVLSLEIAFRNHPADRDIALALGDALTQSGQVGRAESILSDLQRAHPRDPEVAQALKNVSARRTMVEGGYEGLSTGTGSYRDILRDEEEAAALEREHRQVKTEDVALDMIKQYQHRLEKEPRNLQVLRRLAELHVQQKEFDQALEYYQRMIDSGSGGDPTIEKAMVDTQLKKMDEAIASIPADSPNRAEVETELRAQRNAFELAEARKRAERHPNDLQIRFELAKVYFQQGQYADAIREFQRAQINPNLKIQSLRYLGECFFRRGMNDLAVRTLEAALKEKVVFDDEKKQIHYLLGTVLEAMGDAEHAVQQYKLIYEVDIGYKDVGPKVDAYYAQKH